MQWSLKPVQDENNGMNLDSKSKLIASSAKGSRSSIVCAVVCAVLNDQEAQWFVQL